jgi:hypothetical protein
MKVFELPDRLVRRQPVPGGSIRRLPNTHWVWTPATSLLFRVSAKEFEYILYIPYAVSFGMYPELADPLVSVAIIVRA